MELFLLLSSSLLSLLLFMTKIKRWVLVLSSVTIGSLRGSGFAAWKISNPIKNETSFVVDADGNVTEGNKSYIALDTTKGYKNTGIELPTICEDGFYGDAVYAPDSSWGSNSSVLGYPIVSTGFVKVYLKLGYPHGNMLFTLTGSHTQPIANIYCEYREAVPEVLKNGSTWNIDSSNFTKTKSSTQNSYDFDGTIDVSSLSSESSVDLCLIYKANLSSASAKDVKSLANNASALSFSFTASFSDDSVAKETL